MTWLLIDSGNSAVKWARSDADGHHFSGGVESYHPLETQGGLQVVAPLEERLTAQWIARPPQAVFGVCVADDATRFAIEKAVRNVSNLDVTWYGPQRHFEGRNVAHTLALLNGYRDPRQLGADRWHAMIGACAKYPDESLIVAGCGTATTVDCVRAQPLQAAVFLGGAIAPGYQLMYDALAKGTARLPRVPARTAFVNRPLDTEQAIVTGVHYAQIGLVENVTREFAAEIESLGKEPPRLLLTGGRSRALLSSLTRSLLAEKAVSAIVLEDNLVLHGVAVRAYNESLPSPSKRAEQFAPAAAPAIVSQ